MLPVNESMTPVECQRVLRRLELEAYCGLVSVLRAQGELNPEKRELLQSVQQALSISAERHKAEVRRAVNDETLTSICETLNDSNASLEWAIEGRRLVPLIPRLVPQTAYLQIADQAASEAQALNRFAQLAAQSKKSDAKQSTDKSPPSPTVTDIKNATLKDLIVLPHGTKLPGKSVMDNPNPEELFKPKDPPVKTKAIHPHLPFVSSVLTKSHKNATGPLPPPVENPPRSLPAEDPIFTGSSHKTPKVSQSEMAPSSGQKVLFQQAVSATAGYTHPYSAPQGSKYPLPPTSAHMPSKPHFLHTALTGSNEPPRYLGYGQAGKEKEPHPASTHPLPWKEPPKKHTPAVIKKSSKHRKRSKHGATSTQGGSSQSAGKSKTTTAPSVGEPPKTSSSSKKDRLAVFEHPQVSAASTKTMSPVVSSAGSKGSLKFSTSTSAGTGSIFKVTTVGTSTLTTRITTVPSALSSAKYFSAPMSQGSSDYSNIFSSGYKPVTSSPNIVKLNPKALQKAVVQKAGGAQFIPGKPNVIVVQKSQMSSKSGQLPRTIPGMVRPVSPVTARPKIIMATTQSNLSSSHPTLGNVRYPSPKPISTKAQSPVIMSPGGRARQIIPTTIPSSELSSPVKTWSSTHQQGGAHGQKAPVTKSGLLTATKSGHLTATKSGQQTGLMASTKGTSGSSQSYHTTGAVIQKMPPASGNAPSYLHGGTSTLPKSNASPQPGGSMGKKSTQGGSGVHSTEITAQKGGTFGHAAHLPTAKLGQIVTSSVKLADKAAQKGLPGQPVKVAGGAVVQKIPQGGGPTSAVEGVVAASKGSQSASSMVIVKQKTTAIARPTSEVASDEVKGHSPSSKPSQGDSSLGGGLPSDFGKSSQIQAKTSPPSQLTQKQTQDSLISELSAASAARTLLDIRGQRPVKNVTKPAEPRRAADTPAAPVPVATPVSRSETISESASHQKSAKVASKSESLKKSGKGQSPLMTIEDQGVVSERINLSPSDVSIVDQFEEFLEREGLVEAEKSGLAGKETSAVRSQVVTSRDAPQQASKNESKNETPSVGSDSKTGKQSFTVEKIGETGTAEISTEKGTLTFKPASGSAASTTLPVGNEITSTKKHVPTSQAGKPTSRETEKQHITGKYEDGNRVTQKLVPEQDTSVTTEGKVTSGQVVKPLGVTSTIDSGQTEASVQQTHPHRRTAEPVVTKSGFSDPKNRPETGFKLDSINKPDPYQWEDSPEAVEPDVSDLIRAISQPKISLSKMKGQDDGEKEKEEAAKVIKISQDHPTPLKPASIVLESPSSSFDISHMNLEDFTSQRLEEMEEREEDDRFAGEKLESGEEERMTAEARLEMVTREDQESSSTAWQEQEGSQNKVPVEAARSLPGGAGGGKKMPSSDKSLQEDYPLVSGSDSSVSEASGSETQQVRASKRKRKAPTPIDEETGPSSMPSWARAAWNMLLRVMRFRGANRAKGDINAASWFNRPVDPKESPDYFKIIKTPMDFSTIKRNLENGFYQGFADFHHDMIMVRRNCLKFNPPGHKARKDCDEVFQFYQEEYNKTTERWGKVQSAPKSPKRLRPDPSSIK